MASKTNPIQKRAERQAENQSFRVSNAGPRPKGTPLLKWKRENVDLTKMSGARTDTRPGRD